MDIYCEKCQKTVGQVPDDKLPAGRTARISCPGCGEKIVVSKAVDPPAALSPGLPVRQAPSSLPPPPPSSNGRMVPDYDFEVLGVIREAWRRTSGVKGPLWAAGGIVFGLVMSAGILASILELGQAGLAASFALNATLTAAFYPFLAGVMMIGIRHSVGLPVSYQMAFEHFTAFLPILICTFLVSILTTIGFMLLVIPGIYLTVAYVMAIPLIVERGMGAWAAMELSRRTVQRHWFKVSAVYSVMGFIYFLGMIPFGIGIIWTMPMFVMVGGILYREMFGVGGLSVSAH